MAVPTASPQEKTPSQTEFPPVPDKGVPAKDSCECELHKLRYAAELGAQTSLLAEDADNRKAMRAANFTGLQAFHTALTDVAKGSIERWRLAAEAVRTAAAAVGTIYAAVLALAFSSDKPLPPRGLISPAFLGLAIVLATAYVGWAPKTIEDSSVDWPTDTGDARADLRERSSTLIKWVREMTTQRRGFLRGSILALGFGIVFLPVAFIGLGSDTAATSEKANVAGFPTPPTVTSTTTEGEIELLKIRYTAEVAEVSEVRKTQLQAAPGESWDARGIRILYIFAVALALITVTVALTGNRGVGAT